MRHGNTWVLLGAGALTAVLMWAFAPRPAPGVHHAPVRRTDRGGVVEVDGRAMIDLNRADEILLMELPGVGESLARAIIDARPYDSLDDLLRVKGIGEAKLAGLRDRATIMPATEPAESGPQ